MKTIDEKVNPDIKLELILFAKQRKQFEEFDSLPLIEMKKQLLLIVFIRSLVVLESSLEAII
jgi:hypothetical protein